MGYGIVPKYNEPFELALLDLRKDLLNEINECELETAKSDLYLKI